MGMCPNKNLPEWKALEKAQPDLAYYLWDKYDGNVPASISGYGEIKEPLYQIDDGKITEKAIQSLDDYLLNFLKPFGVRSKEFATLKDKLRVDALGATDVLNKLIWYAKDRNVETVPEEVGHMAVMLMGEQHEDIKDLLAEITSWSGYKDIYDQYMPIYNNEKQVKLEAVGKVIAKSLVKNYKESGTDATLLEKAYRAVKQFLDSLVNTTSIAAIMQSTSKLADKVAIQILSGHTSYIGDIIPQFDPLNYEQSVATNDHAKELIDFFTQRNLLLTGSLAVAGANEIIYRDSSAPIHDLDFVVKYDTDFAELRKEIEARGGVPAHNGWGNMTKGYQTDAYLIPKKGYRVVVTQKNNRGFVTGFHLISPAGKVVQPTQDTVLGVDFFTYFDEADVPKGNNFVNTSDIFYGKLTLSPSGKDERMFQREKDQMDYRLSKPKMIHTPKGEFVYYQDEVLPASVNQNLYDIKNAAKKMGINITNLTEYAKENPDIDVKDVNGVADLTQQTIAIAEGRENVALTEEVVHIATAIMEQTNPKMVTNLISKIGRFKIFQDVLNAYKNKPAYQLPNGKPDIRKIKKEAADKLIAELIANKSNDNVMYPELLEETNRSFFRKMWENILDIIRGMYSQTNIDIFKEAADQVLDGDIGTVEDIHSEGVYSQMNNPKNINPAVDKIYDTITSFASRLTLYDATDTDTRHYDYVDDSGETVRVGQSVTERIKKGKPKMREREGLDAIQDASKMKWGDAGHKLIEAHINNNLIDENGYALATPKNTPIVTELEDEVAQKIKEFAENLIESYPSGTRFVIEPKVINTEVKDYVASAVDFMAIVPKKEDDGTDTFELDMLDWKFTSINKDANTDIPWYSQNPWRAQMGEYKKIMYNYGVKYNQIKKTRMVPFIMNYENITPDKAENGLYASSIEMGKVDSTKETDIFLLPVPLREEKTGNEQIDKLVTSLNAHYDKAYSWHGELSPEEKEAKALVLNQLSVAIRKLQVTMSFDPLVGVGRNFLKSAGKIQDYLNVNFDELSEEKIDRILGELLELEEHAAKFKDIDTVFLSVYPKEGLSKEDKTTLKELETISVQAKRMDNTIKDIRNTYLRHAGVKNSWVKKGQENLLMRAYKEVNGVIKMMSEPSKIANPIIKGVVNRIMNVKNTIDVTLGEEMRALKPHLISLQESANARGVKSFDLVGRIADNKLKLIPKLNPDFLAALRKARGDKNKEFILENINKEAFNKEIAELIKKKVIALSNHVYSIDPEENDRLMSNAIFVAKNRLDINLKTFTGFNNPEFTNILYKHLNEEKNLSKDFIEMSKDESALAVWNWFQKWNDKAKDMGYIPKYEDSFFPLIEASAMQKLARSEQGLAGEVKDFFKDQFTGRLEEKKDLSKIDVETGKVRKGITKYFTRTDKNANQLSMDLTEVAPKWADALMNYEQSKNLENELLTIYQIEKNKGIVQTDNEGNIIFDGDRPMTKEGESGNLGILGSLIDSFLYNMSEDPLSPGNSLISGIAERTSKTKDPGDVAQREISIKKTLEFSNAWLRNLAVGLDYAIALANTAGQNFHSFIMKGGNYRFREYLQNELRVISGRISTEERALLDLFTPLSEDQVTEQRRRLSLKTSYLSYLNTWTFSDVVQSTNAYPERLLQFTNGLSFLQNTMIVDGKLVNIRKHVRAQDRKKKQGLSVSERQDLKKTFEERVKTIKETESIVKKVQVSEAGIKIPGVTNEEIARYRVQMMDYGRNLNGQMDINDKAAYKRSTIMRSFMMFKTWIPKLVSVRGSDIGYNLQSESWEYGRVRLFVKIWSDLGIRNLSTMRDIIQQNEKGLKYLDQMLEQKKRDYYRKTGMELVITQEEFNDLVQEELARQTRELKMLFSALGLLVYSLATDPPEDATPYERNQYKYFDKLIHRITDEIIFYYNPVSFQAVTKGNILPSLNLVVSAWRVIREVGEASIGLATRDEDMIEGAHIGKYFLNLIPFGYQFQTDLLPLLDAELAREMGIVVQPSSRGY